MAKSDFQQLLSSNYSSKVGSYPSRNIIISITAALLLIGAFLLFAIHTNKLTKVIQSNIEVQVLLENDLAPADSLQVLYFLTSQPYIVKKNGKPQIRYVSKEEALRQLSQSLKEDVLSNSLDNPLRNYYLINILPEYHRENKLSQIKAELEEQPGIFEVSYSIIAIEKINQNIRIIGVVVFSLVGLLIVLTAFLVHNAIRLALYAQRFTIRSMQLVGATENFIKKPFVLRAAFHGVVSGLIASLILITGLLWLYEVLPDFKQVEDWFATIVICLSLLLLGMLVAAISAFFAVSKYLNRSLDELYKN
ncbi:MAG: permease-like cell division protein FtsX [Cytophagales bacterium]|nr:permease-like cell division protein FtsX [Bernardetiaceae bacterium]MDW8204716.1 permease-like cell division protein FtsX [Cytophagales bacterium]